MKTPSFICLSKTVITLALVFLSGCMGSMIPPRMHDVTSNPSWWGEVHPGEIFVLKQDTLLNGEELTDSAYKHTDTYNSDKMFGGSISVEMFKANPGKYWNDLHLLQKGTKLRCVKIVRWLSDVDQTYFVVTEIQGEQFKAKLARFRAIGDPHLKGSLKLGAYSFVEPE